MSRQIKPDVLVARNELVAAPTLAPRFCSDQSFELPSTLYKAMAGLFFGFLAVMTVGFAEPKLAVPMAINFAFLTAFFAVPAIFIRSAPDASARSMRWSEFMEKGVETETGHASGPEAAILVLILPFLILCFGIAVAAISALV